MMSFQTIAQAALQSIDAVLNHYLPGGQREGQEYLVCNPTRADNKAGSFSINLSSGQWADFATGDKGGDVISLVAYLNGGNQSKARQELAAFLGIEHTTPTRQSDNQSKAAWTAAPIPADAHPPPAANSKLGKPAATWTYHDEVGRVLCLVYRFNLPDGGKEFRPLTYCKNGTTGKREWCWQGLPEPRPLYNLHLLAKYPEATVIVCEG